MAWKRHGVRRLINWGRGTPPRRNDCGKKRLAGIKRHFFSGRKEVANKLKREWQGKKKGGSLQKIPIGGSKSTDSIKATFAPKNRGQRPQNKTTRGSALGQKMRSG